MSEWRKVDVGLVEAETDTNHYDGDHSTAEANDDLEGTDHPGIFYSLEVIKDYKVIAEGGIVTRNIVDTVEDRKTSKKKKSKKQKTQEPAATLLLTVDEKMQEEKDKTVQDEPQKRKKKRKRKRKASATTEGAAQEIDIAAAMALQSRWMQATNVELHLDLCQRMLQFEHPTPIQTAVLPPSILGQSNIVGAAPTGSGKTLAFLLPILQQLWDDDNAMNETESGECRVDALILTPTRELAKQIYQQAVALSRMRNWVGCFTGGLALVKQERVLQQKPKIVIGTPGRLWELIQSGHYAHIKKMDKLRFLVLDEADRMMSTSNGFPELHKIIDTIDRSGSVQRRTFLFSATLTLLGKGVNSIMEKTGATGPIKVVDLSQMEAPGGGGKQKKNSQFQLPPGLKLFEVQCTQRHKDSHLYAYLMMQQSSALIFCNSISAVRRVGQTLRALGWSVRILHANMPQRARFQAVESLNVKNTIVIATDVAARGLDWTAIPTVIHYDAARTVEAFVHRSGRTARGVGGGAVGSSLSLIAPSEDKFHLKLTQKLSLKFETVQIDGRILRESQERVCLAATVAMADDDDRKRQRDQQWFKDQAKEAGIEVDEDLLNELEEDTGASKRGIAKQSAVVSARRKLDGLLRQPLQIQRHGKFLQHTNALQFKLQTPISEIDASKVRKKRRGK